MITQASSVTNFIYPRSALAGFWRALDTAIFFAKNEIMTCADFHLIYLFLSSREIRSAGLTRPLIDAILKRLRE